ncbi:hypothetical protein LEMLEM_LOCUS12250 [Lemmus lemmus]
MLHQMAPPPSIGCSSKGPPFISSSKCLQALTSSPRP